ncbi:MAG: hypothetical protein GIW95_06595 [Candidatus Eremiobacteraeota bacterium]|nr:hypothetical protein [Candidatus Eremiobacteraeota bacterium]
MANRNPGFDYELAVGIAICGAYGVKSDHLLETAALHRQSPKIAKLAKEIAPLIPELQLVGKAETLADVSSEYTQEDTIGPSDLILKLKRGTTVSQLGLSVKMGTAVSHNPSGNRFLSQQQITALKKTLHEATIPEYEFEMNSKYGKRSLWFRKRRRSETTSCFIYNITRLVEDRWNNVLTLKQRLDVARTLCHHGARVGYKTVRLDLRPLRISLIDEAERQRQMKDVRRVRCEISPEMSQYVYFWYEGGGCIAKMQVKFNNGILERDGTPGNPFTSWNFEFLPSRCTS